MVRKKRGGRGGRGEDAWSIKYDNVHIQLRMIINSNASKHTFLYLRGFTSPSKASSLIKPKSKKAHRFYEALDAGL